MNKLYDDPEFRDKLEKAKEEITKYKEEWAKLEEERKVTRQQQQKVINELAQINATKRKLREK